MKGISSKEVSRVENALQEIISDLETFKTWPSRTRPSVLRNGARARLVKRTKTRSNASTARSMTSPTSSMNSLKSFRETDHGRSS